MHSRARDIFGTLQPSPVDSWGNPGIPLSFFSLVFSKIPRKTSKTPRVFLILRTPKTLKISRKHSKRPRNFAPRKTPKKQKTPRKGRVGRRELKGQQDRGNRIESLWEEICLWVGLWEGGFSEIFERFWEVFRGFSEVLRGFERFSEFFERFSEVLSETLSEADFLSEALSPVVPNRVAPWTFSK